MEKIDEEIKRFAENLIETMRINEGIGLAAPQVNVLKRIFVIDLSLINEEWSAKAYINPEILSAEGTDNMEEGCLSIPGIRSDVVRPFKINVRYLTLEGQPVEEELDGLLARVFQHEYDHLEGILFIDKIAPLQKKLLEPRLKELQGAYV
ncbi:MAG: peptide deformylase [Calditrichia bacterium]